MVEKRRYGKLACHGKQGDHDGVGGVFQQNKMVAWDKHCTRVLWLRANSKIGKREARGAARKRGHDGGHGGTPAGMHLWWHNKKCGLPRA